MTSEVEALMRVGKWEDAQAKCQTLLESQPVNPRLNGLLGMCYFRKNDFNSAAASFRRAVTLDPNFWEAGVRLAQSLDRLMEYREALKVAEQYLDQRPNDPQLIALVNGLRRQQGAVDEETWQKSTKGGWHNITLAGE